MKAERGSIWGILATLGKLQIGSTVLTQCYHGIKQPAIGCSFTVLKLKSHFKECLEVEGSFDGLFR
jgi:hypothetical protein